MTKTVVLGAVHIGGSEWQMPKPIGVHETMQVVKVGGKKTKRLEKFPVYRGIDASLARYMRAQVKRAKRKAKEKADDKVD